MKINYLFSQNETNGLDHSHKEIKIVNLTGKIYRLFRLPIRKILIMGVN